MTVATLATCICLQLATQENARDVLLSRDAITLLGPRTKCRPPNYHLLSYCRNIHIAAALLRQHTWRAYDPETFPAEYSHPETIRRLTYIDLLRSTRPMPRTSLPLKPEEEKEINWHLKLGIPDLCVLPEDTHTVLEYSITAESCAAREIAEFLVRPGAPMYVDKLPWEEAVAGCVILDCLCRHPATAASGRFYCIAC